ncbi:MAG: DNA-3-methyladenine glycosylase [Psychromonas sp.]|nr:DNA-3-methyladenine glycosylase [Psychromonas sp.]
MRLPRTYFTDDALAIAPDLLGKKLIRVFTDGSRKEYLISETEAYRGEEDLACHANKGRTRRTQIMYQEGGVVYVYLIYGMYWLLNIVTGEKDHPQAVLIRGLTEVTGPGRIGKVLQLDKSFYGEDLSQSPRIWIEDGVKIDDYRVDKRIGVDYAGEVWANKLWRFIANDFSQ